MRRSIGLAMLSALCLLALLGCPGEVAEEPATEEAAMPEPVPEPAATAVATAHLQGRSDTGIEGTVTFTETGSGVGIVAEVSGVEGAGLHGFHIHETGDCSADDFTSAGGHFNPHGSDHGAPGAGDSHAGDLGNVEIDSAGSGSYSATSTLISVGEGADSVVGRAVILHEGEDDLTSQPTGAAGGRLACGIIALAGDAGEMAGDEMAEDGAGEGM